MESRDIQMKYTIDNPKLVNFCFKPEEDNFTGVVKDTDLNIAYYVNGKLHREDGPAVEASSGDKAWYIHGKLHREDGPAIIWSNGKQGWCYNDELCGLNDKFTVESWMQKCKLEMFK